MLTSYSPFWQYRWHEVPSVHNSFQHPWNDKYFITIELWSRINQYGKVCMELFLLWDLLTCSSIWLFKTSIIRLKHVKFISSWVTPSSIPPVPPSAPVGFGLSPSPRIPPRPSPEPSIGSFVSSMHPEHDYHDYQ